MVRALMYANYRGSKTLNRVTGAILVVSGAANLAVEHFGDNKKRSRV